MLRMYASFNEHLLQPQGRIETHTHTLMRLPFFFFYNSGHLLLEVVSRASGTFIM